MEAIEFYSTLKALIKARIVQLTKEFRAYESANKLGRLDAYEKKMFGNTVKALEINEDYARYYDRKYTRLQ